MKITFPHLGNTYICIKAVLDDLGIDCVIPPFNNKHALELGSKYAPEMACLPLKINIGNYIQAYEMGADTILMAGGCGPCRFGYYSQIHREILKEAGYDMEVITLETTNGDVRTLFESIKQVTGVKGLVKVPNVVRHGVIIAKKVDELEDLTFKLRPREKVKGSVDKVYRQFREKALETKGVKGMRALLKDTFKKLEAIELDPDTKPLKVGIVGEIYTGIEQFASFEIQEKLGGMGVEIDRKVTLSNWIIEHILKKGFHLPRDMSYARAAEPWLGKMIGGHAQETIGHTVIYARNNYDGVIQIFPFSCMPEIVAESILPSVEKELGIPVLTLIIDEMTADTGYMTRVEAFIDLLERRREGGKYKGEWLLSWN